MNKLSTKFNSITHGNQHWVPAITKGLEYNEVRIRNIDEKGAQGIENFFKGFGKVLLYKVFVLKDEEGRTHLTAYASFVDHKVPRRVERMCQGVTFEGRVLRVETAINERSVASVAAVKSPAKLSHLATIALATSERHKHKLSSGELLGRMGGQKRQPTGGKTLDWGKGPETRWMRRWFREYTKPEKTFLFKALHELGMPSMEAVAEDWTALQSLKANFRPRFWSAQQRHPSTRQGAARYDLPDLLFEAYQSLVLYFCQEADPQPHSRLCMYPISPLPYHVTFQRLSPGIDAKQVEEIVIGCVLPLMYSDILEGPRLHTDVSGYTAATFRVSWWMDACAIKFALHNKVRFRNHSADLARIKIF